MVIKSEKNLLNGKKKDRRKIGRAKLCASFLLGLISFSLLLFFLLTDVILMSIREYTKVKNGSFVHELMMKEMEGAHLSATIFNITNAVEFMSGDHDKLKVEEVGPFTYREMRKNIDIDIDWAAQRLRYTPQIRQEYVLEESIGKPEDFNITIPNIPMLSLATMANKFSYWAGMAFNVLVNQVNSKPLINLNSNTYFWGYEEPLISLAHTVVPGSVHFDKMGILDRIYDKKNLNRVEVSLLDDEKFMIKNLNGYSKLKMGDIDPEMCSICNTLENTYEGVGYPMKLTPEFRLRIFRNGLCRILDMGYYNSVTTEYGSEALVYHFNDSFYHLRPEDDNDGVLELPECFFGSPLAFSKPHFVGSDPKIYDKIEGIVPDESRHLGWVTIDAKFGLTLETVFSIQVNLVMGNISTIPSAKRLSNMVLPLLILKIVQPPLPQESINILSMAYNIAPFIILAAQMVLLVLTIISWGYFLRGLYLNYTLNQESMIFPLGTIRKEINANNMEDMTQKLTS